MKTGSLLRSPFPLQLVSFDFNWVLAAKTNWLLIKTIYCPSWKWSYLWKLSHIAQLNLQMMNRVFPLFIIGTTLYICMSVLPFW